jgi:hypothetical protein
MANRDRNIDWLRKHVILPHNRFNLLSLVATNVVEMPASGTIEGILFSADGEEATANWWLPFDMDPSFALKFRVHALWSSTTAADTVLFKVFINNVKRAAVLAKPATALGTALTTTTPGYTVASKEFVTAWGEIAADTWTRAEIEAAHMVNLLVEGDTIVNTQNANNVNFLGLEISYVPQRTKGSEGSRSDNDTV